MIKSFLSFVFIVLLFLSSLGVVAYRLQDPQFVVNSARSVNFYGRLTANLGDAVSSRPEGKEDGTGLDQTELIEAVQSAIDAEQFYDFLSQAGEAYLPWLTGKTDQLQFSYDLAPTKDKLADALTAKTLTKYHGLPLCNSTQLRTWSFKESMPECQLSASAGSSRDIDHQAALLADKMVEPLPDTIASAQPTGKTLAQRDVIARIFKGIYLVWGLTALLLAIYLLIFRSKGLVTLATSFLVVGLLEIAFSLIGWDWILRNLSDSLGGKGGQTQALLPILIDVASVVVEAMKTILGNISIGFLVAGVVLLVTGLISRVRHQTKDLVGSK